MRRVVLALAIVAALAPVTACCGWLAIGKLLDAALVSADER